MAIKKKKEVEVIGKVKVVSFVEPMDLEKVGRIMVGVYRGIVSDADVVSLTPAEKAEVLKRLDFATQSETIMKYPEREYTRNLFRNRLK